MKAFFFSFHKELEPNKVHPTEGGMLDIFYRLPSLSVRFLCP